MTTRVGYFCTDVYTEIFGLGDFLQKINEHVRWERCFPAKRKLVPGALPPTGTSGSDLVSKMKEYLRYGCEYDYLLLIDDEDCRFHGKELQEFLNWKEQLQSDIRQIVDRDVELIVLFASPEIETWFLVDWQNGLGGYYPRIQYCLNKNVQEKLGEFYTNPEGYGDGYNGDSCVSKLSECLIEIVRLCGTNGETFKKGVDSAEILKKIQPERVASRCTRFFAPAYQLLREIR